MAAVNQDFITFAGDVVSPIFTVQDVNGNPVNISTVTNIFWNVRVNELTPVLVSKSKSAGQIAFTTDGSNGQFQVTIGAADTTLLNSSGDFFLHQAQIIDAGGNQTTVTVGRMQVGVTPQWTYNAGLLATFPLYQVRYLIGDTIESDQQLYDAEINFSLSQYSNVYLAAADCCRSISSKFARKVDTVQGEMRTLYGQQTKNYAAKAIDLEQRGLIRGGAMPFAGGISIADKTTRASDSDRVPPAFNVEMHDNYLPVAPVGEQTPTPGSPDQQSSDAFPV